MPADQSEPASALDVREDRRWQEVFWTVQRIGWALMGLFIVAALLGATGGGGPLSTAKAETSTGSVEYPAISRWESSEQIVFRFQPGSSAKAHLTLSPQFDQVFAADSILPQPSAAVATAAGHRYTFDLEGTGEKQIVFNVTTGKPALARHISARIGAGPPARLTVTVLP
jgi:protein-L-isoaspartate(D-aspartate) O-methyltransferase